MPKPVYDLNSCFCAFSLGKQGKESDIERERERDIEREKERERERESVY